jgi:hypothetical protein
MENQNEGISMNISINKAIWLVVFAGGILLLIFGINAYNSSSSDISRFFTGSATDKSLWMLVGGVVAIILGLAGLTMYYYSIAVIIVVLWLLGFVSSYTMGGFIHILLVLAIVVVLLGVIRRRKPV